MTWTTPKTWSFQEVLTAADMNTYVRDNSNHLLRTLGSNGAVYGFGVADVGELDVQCGSAVLTFSGGLATMNWPVGWSTTIVSVLLTSGDSGVSPNCIFEVWTATLSALTIRITDTVVHNNPAVTTRVNWIAVGK